MNTLLLLSKLLQCFVFLFAHKTNHLTIQMALNNLFCVTLAILASYVQARMHNPTFLNRIDSWECPDAKEFVEENPEYSLECVESSLPPWPLCLFHGVDYFVDAAISSASRCCDYQDNEECRCPFKEKMWWKNKMKGWCEDISSCTVSEERRLASVDSKLETEFWTKYLNDE